MGLPSASVASGFQVCFLLKQPCNNMTAYSNNKATWQVAMYDSYRDGYACCPVSSVPVMVRRRGRSGLCGQWGWPATAAAITTSSHVDPLTLTGMGNILSLRLMLG